MLGSNASQVEAKEKAYVEKAYGDKASIPMQAGQQRMQEPSAYEATLREQLYAKREALYVQVREIEECLQSLNEPTVQKVLRVLSVAQ